MTIELICTCLLLTQSNKRLEIDIRAKPIKQTKDLYYIDIYDKVKSISFVRHDIRYKKYPVPKHKCIKLRSDNGKSY